MVVTDKQTWRWKTRCSTEVVQRKINRPINSGKRVESMDRVDRFSVELSRFVRLDRFQGLLHNTRLTALFLGLSGWAGTRKVKPIWILLKQETVSGSGISWTICKSAPLQTDNHASTPTLRLFTGRMPFLPPNQQRQSTEGKVKHSTFKNITTQHYACASKTIWYPFSMNSKQNTQNKEVRTRST